MFGFLVCFCFLREGGTPLFHVAPIKPLHIFLIVIVCHLLQVVLPLVQIFGGTLALAVYSLITG